MDKKFINETISANIEINSGIEYRLQEIYEYELWEKIMRLGINSEFFSDKIVLDICCGSGFLSYHLLKRCNPKKMVMIDISKIEVNSAKKLLNTEFKDREVLFIVNNAMKTSFMDESFDIIIGKTFLHHFFYVPDALIEFKRLLRKGGFFISQHEPTPVAVALESGNLSLLLKFLLVGDKYIEPLRYKGQGIETGFGQDIWMFNKGNFFSILMKLGMNEVDIKHFNFLRPLFVAKFALHLNQSKPLLKFRENEILKKGIDFDRILSKIIPKSFYKSITIKAEKCEKSWRMLINIMFFFY